MVKDRVWFFAAYDRVITDQAFAPTTGPGTGIPFPDTITENKYSLKLTLNLAQSTTLQGVYFSDRQSTTRHDFRQPAELQSVRDAGPHRRRRPRLRRAFEPALRLERHPDAGLRPALRPFPDEAGRSERSPDDRPDEQRHPGLSRLPAAASDRFSDRSTTTSRSATTTRAATPGTSATTSSRPAATTTNVSTSGSTYWTGSDAQRDPSLPAGLATAPAT